MGEFSPVKTLHHDGIGQASILMVGGDAALLSYRQQVLQRAGWKVLSAAPRSVTTEMMDGGAKLCIFCHTLAKRERAELTRLVRTSAPQMRILAITAGEIDRAEAGTFDGLVENLEGPACLIEAVRRQIS